MASKTQRNGFINFRYLDLSYNKFQDIVSGTLRGHHKLEMLHLENNNLIRVGREVFSNMPSLRELRLANNSLSNFLEFPLWNLPSLKVSSRSEVSDLKFRTYFMFLVQSIIDFLELYLYIYLYCTQPLKIVH